MSSDSESEKKEGWTEKVLKDIMTANVPNLSKDKNRFFSKMINLKKTIPKTFAKFQKLKTKKKYFQSGTILSKTIYYK